MAKLQSRTRTTRDEGGRFTPEHLADWLDHWALRREKVLSMLDIKAAQAARVLAFRCVRIGHLRASLPETDWREAWHQLRLEVAAFLQEERRGGTGEP